MQPCWIYRESYTMRFLSGCSVVTAVVLRRCGSLASAGGQAPTPAVNALTTIAYVLKKNVDSPQLAGVLPLLGGRDFSADQLDTLLGVAFSLANAGTSIPSTNYVSGLLVRFQAHVEDRVCRHMRLQYVSTHANVRGQRSAGACQLRGST